MELTKSLGEEGKEGGLWVEYTRAYKKVEEEYKNNLKSYYKNYSIVFVGFSILLFFIQQSLASLFFTLPIFVLGYVLIFFLNKITFILHVQDLKIGETLREVANRRFKEEGRMETYQEFRAKTKEYIKKMKAETRS